MMNSHIFFPILNRRAAYRLMPNGEYYADYRQYRQEIREDCIGRCVYCDCHENELSGSHGMNIDHFRPKALHEFRHLVNDPNNLVWTCGRCNRKKSNHWPASGTDETVVNNQGFIDPFFADRREYFQVDEDGKLVPLRHPALYMVELLGLNSHTPRSKRKQRIDFINRIEQHEATLAQYSNRDDLSDEVKTFLNIVSENKMTLTKYLDFQLY